MVQVSLRRQGKRAFVWVVAIAVVATAVGVGYFGTPLHGASASVTAVEENPNVELSQQNGDYIIEPAGNSSDTGLVFYPGGRIHPDAYLATLTPLAAESNVTVVVPEMPLNIAYFDRGAAARYVSGSEIDTWYVGGHSLGGVMACRYANQNQDAVDGVVLFASYCDRNISATGLSAISITGSADTVLDRSAYEANSDNLPQTVTLAELPVNHSQFGSYRGQSGDSPSSVSYEQAHERITDVLRAWLQFQR